MIEFQISTTTFHDPSAPLRQTKTSLPVSTTTGWFGSSMRAM